MGQILRRRSATLHVMTTQTIPEYLEEERQKAADTQLRTDEEAARIQPLQHGHHRTAKQPRVELLPPVKTAAKKKKRKRLLPELARSCAQLARSRAPREKWQRKPASGRDWPQPHSRNLQPTR